MDVIIFSLIVAVIIFQVIGVLFFGGKKDKYWKNVKQRKNKKRRIIELNEALNHFKKEAGEASIKEGISDAEFMHKYAQIEFVEADIEKLKNT